MTFADYAAFLGYDALLWLRGSPDRGAHHPRQMVGEMSAPSLFDAAAESVALKTGKPLSQVRLEIERPVPAPPPADGLFGLMPASVCVHGTTLETFSCPACEADLKALSRKRGRSC